jgi:1-acyl-sn-glycerol-3-phosphate acyltransferase
MEKRIDAPSKTYRAAALGLIALNKFPFGRVTASGLENIADEGPQVLAFSHHNSWDVPGLGMTVYRHNQRLVHFLTKEELLGKIAVGPLLKSMHSLPINRDGKATMSQMRQTMEALESGALVALAPEGGRVNGRKIAELKGGVGFFAAKANAQVIPVGIAGDNYPLPLGAYLPRPLHIHFGEPLEPGGGKAGRQRIDNSLRSAMQAALDTASARIS